MIPTDNLLPKITGQDATPIILKVNYNGKIHRNELKIMKHLNNSEVPGVSKMIDHGEIFDDNLNLSVKNSHKNWFLAI